MIFWHVINAKIAFTAEGQGVSIQVIKILIIGKKIPRSLKDW